MQTFQALSYGDKWRVSRFVTRGEAPDDPRMAAAAVELAESYQRQNRTYMGLMRWLPAILVVGFGYVNIPAAVEGNVVMAILYALFVLSAVGLLMFNPATRPKNMARSLEASKRIVASGG